MSVRALVLTSALASISLALPRAASAADLYARAVVGPAYFHNDDVVERYDTSGIGLAAQLDFGARVRPALVLHGSLVFDASRWMGFDATSGSHEYETTVLGTGIGVATTLDRWSLGAVLGAQLTWHPGGADTNDGPDGAGLGPLFSVTAGYVFPAAVDGVELGAHALARYRVGKDQDDPSGYQLGLGLSVALVDEDTATSADEAADAARRRSASVGYASAHIGWWNAELEFLTKPGLYLAVGAPWVGVLLTSSAEDRTVIPFGARVGYQLDASEEWKVRFAAHLAGLKNGAGRCYGCQSYGTESWQFFEVGARHESASGFVYGIDVPLFVINDVLGLDQDTSAEEEFFAPPQSLIFTQVYVGYSWAI